jgi:hypothetical protein
MPRCIGLKGDPGVGGLTLYRRVIVSGPLVPDSIGRYLRPEALRAVVVGLEPDAPPSGDHGDDSGRRFPSDSGTPQSADDEEIADRDVTGVGGPDLAHDLGLAIIAGL